MMDMGGPFGGFGGEGGLEKLVEMLKSAQGQQGAQGASGGPGIVSGMMGKLPTGPGLFSSEGSGQPEVGPIGQEPMPAPVPEPLITTMPIREPIFKRPGGPIAPGPILPAPVGREQPSSVVSNMMSRPERDFGMER